MPARIVRTIAPAVAEAAIDAITARRRRDDTLAELTDQPLDVIEYVLAHTRVPARVLAADIGDALLLCEYARLRVPALPGTLDALEHRLLVLGRDTGMSLTELAQLLGVASKQVVEQRMLRYEAAMRGNPRTPRAERAARRSERREQAWLARHGDALLTALDEVLARRDLLPEELRFDADYLASETRPGIPGPAGRGYRQQMGRAASQARELLAELAELDEVPAGLDGPVRRLQALLAAHYATL